MNSAIIDFYKDERWHHIFYNDPNQQEVDELNKFLITNKDKEVYLYHGTRGDYPILEQGLKPTTKTRRNSYQSASGFVYLSVFPGSAKNFANAAFPTRKTVVYKVRTKISELKPDLDQLFNRRLYSGRELGNTLGESLAYGYGARVKGKIKAERIEIYKEGEIQ